MNRVYVCIDLKSFYASVECVERGLDPLTTNLVVADNSRTEKTICLAVSPSLKKYGIGGRARLFEVIEKVKEINKMRNKPFCRKSYNDLELEENNNLELDYIVATPRMGLYIKYSTDIYNIYLKYLSLEDIFVYSIDEVFMDVTKYLKLYKCSTKELVTRMIRDVLKKTGITATAGIGTNLYLAKVAMDIVAKKQEADCYGVRIAELDEFSYREKLWNHRPLTDFWRVGNGISRTLEKNHLYTMGDIARCSLEGENRLFKLFGINAELLIDHAWGWEPCTLNEIRSYKPKRNSLSSGQVLKKPYDYDKTKIIVKEMTELLILDMVSKHYKTNCIVLTIGYDISNVDDNYKGDIVVDYYGRSVPKHAHGTIRIDHYTSSTKIIKKKVLELFENIIDKKLYTRRINVSFCNLKLDSVVEKESIFEQLDLFNNTNDKELEKNELKVQNTILKLKERYGKNAVLIGTNLEEGATTIERNMQIGGHRA